MSEQKRDNTLQPGVRYFFLLLVVSLLSACAVLPGSGSRVVYVVEKEGAPIVSDDMTILVERFRHLHSSLLAGVDSYREEQEGRLVFRNGAPSDSEIVYLSQHPGRFQVYADDSESPWFSQADIRGVESGQQGGSSYLDIIISDEAARRVTALSRQNIGQRVTVSLDGEVLMEPFVQSELGKRFRVTAGSPGQAERLEAVLSYGVLSQPYVLQRRL